MMNKFGTPNFNDVEFPARNSVLSKAEREKEVDWLRHQSRQAVFGKYVDPNDIRPGSMSAPELLSAMSCIAENERGVKRIIEDQHESADGFYVQRLNINGVYRYPFVDDKLPFFEHEPLGCCSYPDNEIEGWPALLEKAYAKAYAPSYEILNFPTSYECYLRDLTGAPIQVFQANDPNLYNAAKEATDRGQPIMAIPNENVLKFGFNPNYALNVVSAGKGNLILRNPWGTITEKSSITTDREGRFEWAARQVSENIDRVLIAQVREHYYTTTVQTKHRKGFFCTYTFNVEDHIDGFFSVSQIDRRTFPAKSTYDYSPLRFILEKKSVEEGAILINGAYNFHSRNIDLEVSLSPGEYTIHIIADWLDKEYDFFLTFYGCVKLDMKKVYTREFPKLLTQSLDKVSIENGQMSTRGNVNEYVLYHEDTNLIVVTAENTGDDTNHTLDLSKVEFKNLTLLNARHEGENFKGKTKEELVQMKNDSVRNKRWNISLKAGGKYTWVLSTNEPYNPDNLRKYKF